MRWARAAACGIVRHHDDGLAVLTLSVVSSSRISSPALRSRSPVGSSHSSSVGSVTMARAMPTRCSWPPESWRGLWLARSPRPTSSARSARGACARPRSFVSSSGSSTFRPRSAPAAGCTSGRRSRCAARASSPACFPQLVDALAGDLDRPADGVSRPPDQVQQRRLARARRPHEREEVALRHVEVDALEDVDPFVAAK